MKIPTCGAYALLSRSVQTPVGWISDRATHAGTHEIVELLGGKQGMSPNSIDPGFALNKFYPA